MENCYANDDMPIFHSVAIASLLPARCDWPVPASNLVFAFSPFPIRQVDGKFAGITTSALGSTSPCLIRSLQPDRQGKAQA